MRESRQIGCFCVFLANMRILYIGGGFVGACSAAVSADSGHEVLVYDIDKERVKKLSSLDKDTIESCLFEDGLGELIIRNASRIKFSCDFAEVEKFLDSAGAVFMCLPTPEKDHTGRSDLTYYNQACKDLAAALAGRNKGEQNNYILVINKSTVPIEMIGVTEETLRKKGVKNFGVGANPEFLVEGDAIAGSIRPQRLVVGAWREKDFSIFREIYNRFCDAPNVSYIEVNPIEAAAGKLLANFILFNRLANCYDVVGRTCEKFTHMTYENVRKIIITDKRIGDWGFYDSLFAGGSCFIKDARSLGQQLREKDTNVDLVSNTLEANNRQINRFLSRPKFELGYAWPGKKVGILGLAFKRNTNDIRNSAALNVTEFLLDHGVGEILAYDPAAADNYLNYFKGHAEKNKIKAAKEEKEVMEGADALFIITDWPQFRGLYEPIMANLPKGALIMDGRRTLYHKYGDLSKAGYDIIAVGSPVVKHGT